MFLKFKKLGIKFKKGEDKSTKGGTWTDDTVIITDKKKKSK